MFRFTRQTHGVKGFVVVVVLPVNVGTGEAAAAAGEAAVIPVTDTETTGGSAVTAATREGTES